MLESKLKDIKLKERIATNPSFRKLEVPPYLRRLDMRSKSSADLRKSTRHIQSSTSSVRKLPKLT